MHKLHVPSIVRFLEGNYTVAFRDPETILVKYKLALPQDLLKKLKSVLYNENPAKLNSYTTVAERAKYRNYGNYTTIIKNKTLVYKVMNKEE